MVVLPTPPLSDVTVIISAGMPVEYRVMATAAPFVKLLRQLSSAKDEYRSGALDITWDGSKATLFFVFGQPNHATYESEGETTLEGPDALAALLHNLPQNILVNDLRFRWPAATRRCRAHLQMQQVIPRIFCVQDFKMRASGIKLLVERME